MATTRRRQVVAAYLIVAAVLYPVLVGLEVSDLQAIGGSDAVFACRMLRRNVRFAMQHAGVCAAVWPIGVPMVLLLTGFAEHGIYNTNCPRQSGR